MTHPTSGKRRIGARVSLRELDSVPDEFRGLAGTITQNFGPQDPAAHEVGVDGGGSQLFWHYELRTRPPMGRQVSADRALFTEEPN